jgi:hypothetical protein
MAVGIFLGQKVGIGFIGILQGKERVKSKTNKLCDIYVSIGYAHETGIYYGLGLVQHSTDQPLRT